MNIRYCYGLDIAIAEFLNFEFWKDTELREQICKILQICVAAGYQNQALISTSKGQPMLQVHD